MVGPSTRLNPSRLIYLTGFVSLIYLSNFIVQSTLLFFGSKTPSFLTLTALSILPISYSLPNRVIFSTFFSKLILLASALSSIDAPILASFCLNTLSSVSEKSNLAISLPAAFFVKIASQTFSLLSLSITGTTALLVPAASFMLSPRSNSTKSFFLIRFSESSSPSNTAVKPIFTRMFLDKSIKDESVITSS